MPRDVRPIVLLTRERCAYCDDAKEILSRLSEEFGMTIEVVDLDTPEGTQMAETSGVLFAPGIVVGEILLSHGRPSERRLRRELTRLGDSDRRT